MTGLSRPNSTWFGSIMVLLCLVGNGILFIWDIGLMKKEGEKFVLRDTAYILSAVLGFH